MTGQLLASVSITFSPLSAHWDIPIQLCRPTSQAQLLQTGTNITSSSRLSAGGTQKQGVNEARGQKEHPYSAQWSMSALWQRGLNFSLELWIKNHLQQGFLAKHCTNPAVCSSTGAGLFLCTHTIFRSCTAAPAHTQSSLKGINNPKNILFYSYFTRSWSDSPYHKYFEILNGIWLNASRGPSAALSADLAGGSNCCHCILLSYNAVSLEQTRICPEQW